MDRAPMSVTVAPKIGRAVVMAALALGVVFPLRNGLGAVELLQPTWGRPKETKPKPTNPNPAGRRAAPPGDDGMETEPREDYVGDPDAPPGEGAEEDGRGAEASVSPGGTWRESDQERKQPTYECEGDVWYAATTKGSGSGNSGGGVRFLWVMPAGFEKGKAYDIVVILHPKNENVRWGMSTHGMSDPETGGRFRPKQIVVCVDGLTVTGRDAERRSFIPGASTIVAFRDVMLELSRTFPIKRMYLYGVGEGADFAAVFAQRFPALADGVVLYRPGAGVKALAAKGSAPLAIVHGARDSLLSVGSSIATYDAFVEAGHTGVRLRVLPAFNDYPNPVRVSECIDWMLAMKSDDPGEILAGASAILTPKGSDEFGYVGPVWYTGAYEALARITGVPADAETEKENAGPWKKLDHVSDEMLAAASAMQARIEAEATKHIEGIKGSLGQGSGQAGEFMATAIAPDGTPGAAWLWQVRQDFRMVRPLEEYVEAMGYDALLKEHLSAAEQMNQAWAGVSDSAEKAAIAAEWVPRAFLAPTLPLTMGSVAKLAAQKEADNLEPDVLEAMELIGNVEQTWGEGSKAYGKLWRQWSVEGSEEE